MFEGSLALAFTTRPNESVKETRRPLAVLKVCFYQGSVASLTLNNRRACNVRLLVIPQSRKSGFLSIGAE